MHTLNKVIIWNPYCIERSCELVLSTMQNGVFARLLMRELNAPIVGATQWMHFVVEFSQNLCSNRITLILVL